MYVCMGRYRYAKLRQRCLLFVDLTFTTAVGKLKYRIEKSYVPNTYSASLLRQFTLVACCCYHKQCFFLPAGRMTSSYLLTKILMLGRYLR